VALVKLSRPVTFSSVISPVCLPRGAAAVVGSTGVVTGWVSEKRVFHNYWGKFQTQIFQKEKRQTIPFFIVKLPITNYSFLFIADSD